MKLIVYLAIATGVSSAHAGSYDDFFKAIKFDDVATVQQLVGRGFDPNSRDAKGQPAIVSALIEGSNDVALALAQLPGSQVDVVNANGETPLMFAALKGQLDVCKALMARGAAINRQGWTPLHYAASGDSLSVVRLLLEQGAAVDARAPNGRTPLMQAALYGTEDGIAALLAAGADRALRDGREATAADLARNVGRDHLIERLRPRSPR